MNVLYRLALTISSRAIFSIFLTETCSPNVRLKEMKVVSAEMISGNETQPDWQKEI